MKQARHENLFGLDYGVDAPYDEFTPQEVVLVDFRLNLPENDRAHLNMQYGLEGIGRDMVSSPYAKAWAAQKDQERIDAIMLELKTCIRI